VQGIQFERAPIGRDRVVETVGGHESEADEVGIRYAIRAGYDPYEAVRLWERMAQLGSSGPEWLSTHPDSMRRAHDLETKIPHILAEEGRGAPKTGKP